MNSTRGRVLLEYLPCIALLLRPTCPAIRTPQPQPLRLLRNRSSRRQLLQCTRREFREEVRPREQDFGVSLKIACSRNNAAAAASESSRLMAHGAVAILTRYSGSLSARCAAPPSQRGRTSLHRPQHEEYLTAWCLKIGPRPVRCSCTVRPLGIQP
jgi:hypothetical protein